MINKEYFRCGSAIRILSSDEDGEKFWVQKKFTSINAAKRTSRKIQAEGKKLRCVDAFPKTPDLKEISAEDLLAS